MLVSFMGKRISSALNRAEPYIALRLIIDKSLRTYTSVEDIWDMEFPSSGRIGGLADIAKHATNTSPGGSFPEVRSNFFVSIFCPLRRGLMSGV